MFFEHFKLGLQPFGVTPDTRFLYLSRTHREALASLLYGIRSGRGFTALIAAPGMGKTTLLFRVLSQVATITKTAFLFQTLCAPREFLRALLADLEIDDEGRDVARMHAKLNGYLLRESKNGRHVVVVIDEAQNLDESVLEVVRMLSNFETPCKKLMHIILSGQPQLAEKLASERLTQLRQRISILARLAPFTAAETREYIEYRLSVAGAASKRPLFSDKAYAMIAEHSRGIPRNINNLCFNSMSLAWALRRPQVDALMVQESINDLDLSTIPSHKPPEVRQQSRPLAFARALALGILAFLVWVSIQVLDSNERMQSQSMGSLAQEETVADSKVSSLSQATARQGAQDQKWTEEKAPTRSVPDLLSVTQAPGQRTPENESRPFAAISIDGNSGVKSSELLPSPQQPHETELSQNKRMSLDEKRLEEAQASQKEEHVPFALALQRGKR